MIQIRFLPLDSGLEFSHHGHSGFTRWLWGSLAEGISRVSPCPVMLVRRETPSAFQRILVPFDGSEPSWNVLEQLAPFIDRASAKITLLHCSDWKKSEDWESQAAREMAYRHRCDLKNLTEQSDRLVLKFSSSPAPAGIEEWLAHNPCDLVAMSTHGRSGLAHLLTGSVTEQVARRANCPVLVFPPATRHGQVASPA